MKRKLPHLSVFAFILLLTACVDDYQDANPPALLDAPAVAGVTVSSPTSLAGTTATITVTVSDAPAGIDSVAVRDIDSEGDEIGGTFSIAGATGLTQGSFDVTYTPPSEFVGTATVEVEVYDGQLDEKGRSASKSSVTQSVDVTFICDPDFSGTYDSEADGNWGSGGANSYSDLEAEVSLTVISCTEYRIDDMSFGVYDQLYDDSSPSGILIIDGTTITGDEDNIDQYDDPFTINGTINGDGSITLSWSNTYGDSGDATITPQ